MKTKSLISAMALIATSTTALAQDLEITVTNLSHGLYFTPILTTAHTSDNSVFSLTTAASPDMSPPSAIACNSGLVSILSNANANTNANPASGLLAPAMSTSYMLTNDSTNTHLSLTAMILPSNDGFVGLDSWQIPTEAGTYTIMMNAYDAGTEANNELVIDGSGAPNTAGIPAAPGGSGGSNGTGVTDNEANMMVHIHRGTLGDDDSMAGNSDLDNRVHRWLNPVAKLTVIVK